MATRCRPQPPVRSPNSSENAPSASKHLGARGRCQPISSWIWRCGGRPATSTLVTYDPLGLDWPTTGRPRAATVGSHVGWTSWPPPPCRCGSCGSSTTSAGVTTSPASSLLDWTGWSAGSGHRTAAGSRGCPRSATRRSRDGILVVPPPRASAAESAPTLDPSECATTGRADRAGASAATLWAGARPVTSAQPWGRAGTARLGADARVSNLVLAKARSVRVISSRTSRAR